MVEARKSKKKIVFMLNAPEAQNVALAGTFNDWNRSSHPMKRSRKGKKEEDYWQLRVSLEPGTYQYLFLVDGQWRNDSDSSDRVPNEFGTLSDLIRV
jgi:1,4-alpha-glucan branching enzyme